MSATLAADFVFLGASGVASAIAVAGKMTEPANPAPRVAMAPMKERRSLNAGPDSRLSSFSERGDISSNASRGAAQILKHFNCLLRGNITRV